MMNNPTPYIPSPPPSSDDIFDGLPSLDDMSSFSDDLPTGGTVSPVDTDQGVSRTADSTIQIPRGEGSEPEADATASALEQGPQVLSTQELIAVQDETIRMLSALLIFERQMAAQRIESLEQLILALERCIQANDLMMIDLCNWVQYLIQEVFKRRNVEQQISDASTQIAQLSAEREQLKLQIASLHILVQSGLQQTQARPVVAVRTPVFAFFPPAGTSSSASPSAAPAIDLTEHRG